MTPPRFSLPSECITPPAVNFPPDRCAQVSNVLRLKTGAVVNVFGQDGAEHQVVLTSVSRNAVQGRIENTFYPDTEPRINLELWVCSSRREKVEWVIQKCTEIGASSFRFLVSGRSLVQNLADIETKTARWQQIAMEAAEQSGRVKVPAILPPLHYRQAVMLPFAADVIRCIAWERDQNHTVQDILPAKEIVSKAILLVGPEGGFNEDEVQLAEKHGFQPVTLGKRVYRLETAAMVGCVLLLEAFNSL